MSVKSKRQIFWFKSQTGSICSENPPLAILQALTIEIEVNPNDFIRDENPIVLGGASNYDVDAVLEGQGYRSKSKA
jgi:hypothetical protein